MVGSQLPEPILAITFEAIEKIQGGEESVSALWSVFSRVKEAVENGRRLENMSWRLWHCARVAPKRQYAHSLSTHLPPFSKTLPRPLSSPSLSFSSSSDGTATSSDWDRDTAVGEDDDVHALHSSGARRNTAISPRLDKPRLSLPSGTYLQASVSPPALSSRKSHQRASSHDTRETSRQLPLVASESTPHHSPHADSDAGTDFSYERAQDTSISVSLHQCASCTLSIAGPKDPSPPPHTLPAHLPNSIPTGNLGRSISSHPNHPNHPNLAPVATVTSSSMPVVLPSVAGPRKEALSVGRIIADLFPEKKPVCTVCNKESRVQAHGAPLSGTHGRTPAPPLPEQANLPQIIEPRPSTPAAGRTWFSNNSSSTTTSTTSTPRQMFPTVVVVNPTPHPTPPATPSSDVSEPSYGLKPTATPFDRPDTTAEGWNGAANGQLATPVSSNGDARSLSPTAPKFVMVEPKSLKGLHPHFLNADITALPLQTSLLPAAAITLPERPSDSPASHLPTPSSNPHSELANSSKLITAPIPAFTAAEDKKFFLTAPHSSSGHESSESPDSIGVGSASPQKIPQMEGKDRVQAVLSREREEVASSFSAGSLGARPPSVTSSRGGPRHKGRVGFNVTGGGRRRQGGSKKVAMTAMTAKQPARKDAEAEPKDIETPESRSKKEENERKQSSRGKERVVGENPEALNACMSTAGERLPDSHKAQKHQSSHRPAATQQPSQNLRQLPTNPPRQQTQPPVHRPAADSTPATSTGQLAHTRLPLHPQLGHLGLAHLPTVPPRPRRPIEITETSSDYETTDTDESSWESESLSGEEAGEGERLRSTHASGDARSRTSGGNTGSRTRDAGEFQRDAEREAQRAREMFQKLPSRSYSNIAQLPRTKSGLSMLFKPDPGLFPEGHPYRTSHSSRDILARNWSMPAPPRAMAAMAGRSVAAGATVIAESAVASVSVGPSSSQRTSGSQQQRRGYRRRGPPQGQEHETDSGDENPEDAIQLSSSVAQRRLAAIMGQRPTTTQARRPSPAAATLSPESQEITRTTTAPMLMHPYLPDPAPLQTPHTVRRNIIAQELDEELRRNLLWERSQNQIQGRPPRAAGSILPGPWRPLATRPEESRETQSNTLDTAPGRRPFATQRTKSWAGDYHAAGW